MQFQGNIQTTATSRRETIQENMKRLVLIVCFVMVGLCTAQLNFSPGWGKRAMVQAANAGGTGDSTCKTSVESLMLIYKLIQVGWTCWCCNVSFNGMFLFVAERGAKTRRLYETTKLNAAFWYFVPSCSVIIFFRKMKTIKCVYFPFRWKRCFYFRANANSYVFGGPPIRQLIYNGSSMP